MADLEDTMRDNWLSVSQLFRRRDAAKRDAIVQSIVRFRSGLLESRIGRRP